MRVYKSYMITKRETCEPVPTKRPRNQKHVFERLNHQNRITFKPNIMPTFVFSSLHGYDDNYNFRKNKVIDSGKESKF